MVVGQVQKGDDVVGGISLGAEGARVVVDGGRQRGRRWWGRGRGWMWRDPHCTKSADTMS